MNKLFDNETMMNAVAYAVILFPVVCFALTMAGIIPLSAWK